MNKYKFFTDTLKKTCDPYTVCGRVNGRIIDSIISDLKRKKKYGKYVDEFGRISYLNNFFYRLDWFLDDPVTYNKEQKLFFAAILSGLSDFCVIAGERFDIYVRYFLRCLRDDFIKFQKGEIC